MSKTSRFRHRRDQSEQRKVRAADHPKLLARSSDAEKPLANPLTAPLTTVVPVEGSIFDGDFSVAAPKAAHIGLVKLSQGVRDELHTRNSPLSKRSTVPAIKRDENQKRLRNSSQRKDVR